MARTMTAALVALGILAGGSAAANAQCPEGAYGEPGCGGVELRLGPREPGPAPEPPPSSEEAGAPESPIPPPPESARPAPPPPPRPASGAVLALDILYSPRATMVGGLLTGFYGLTPRFALSLAFGTMGRRDAEDGDHRETPISAGGILVLTPGARFRITVPLRTGVAIHHQGSRAGLTEARFAIYTLDAGVSGHLVIHGPAYVGGTIRGQLQVTPWDHQVDFAASFEVDLALVL